MPLIARYRAVCRPRNFRAGLTAHWEIQRRDWLFLWRPVMALSAEHTGRDELDATLRVLENPLTIYPPTTVLVKEITDGQTIL